MKKNMNYIKYAIDIVMAITFVLFFNKQVLGGLSFHEIAGLAITAVFFTHIFLNWKWVVTVTRKFFQKNIPVKTKLGYVLNLFLLMSMGFIIVSGVLISKVVFPNINVGNERWFQVTHISVSFLVLILVAVHIGLHWKWVVDVSKRMLNIRAHKPFLGLLAKFASVALLVFGSYEIYATNFISHIQGVSSLFTSTSSSMPGAGIRNGGDGGFAKGEFARGERPEMGDGDGFVRGAEMHGGFRGGDEGTFAGPHVLGVIGTYFGIMSVFIIIVYYLEKLIRSTKRHKNHVALNEVKLS